MKFKTDRKVVCYKSSFFETKSKFIRALWGFYGNTASFKVVPSHTQFSVNKCEDINHKVCAGCSYHFHEERYKPHPTRHYIHELKNCQCNLSHGSSTKNENHNWEFMKKLPPEKCVTSLSYNLFMTAHKKCGNLSFLRVHEMRFKWLNMWKFPVNIFIILEC